MKGPLSLVALLSFFVLVLAQQTEYRRDPPRPSEFPRARNSCVSRHKLYVSAVAGVPVGSDRGSATVSCQFTTVDCTGTAKLHASPPRPGGQDVCSDWVAARDTLAAAAIEMCCDPPDSNQNPPPEEPKRNEKCPPSVPWLDNSSACTERRPPWVAKRGNEIVVSICGHEVFRGRLSDSDRLLVEAYRSAVEGEIKAQAGSTFCCDTFRRSIASGVPCDPSKDLDCDGVPNQSDRYRSGEAYYPDITVFTRAPGAKIDRFPTGLNPDDPDFLPNRAARESRNVGECPCKWELTKGELKCSRDGRERHVYLATWKCPVTGAEVITTKSVPASVPCSGDYSAE